MAVTGLLGGDYATILLLPRNFQSRSMRWTSLDSRQDLFGDIVFAFNMDDHSNQGNSHAIDDTVRNVSQSGFTSGAHEELKVELQ